MTDSEQGEINSLRIQLQQLKDQAKDHVNTHVCFGPEDISEDFECKYCHEKHDFQIIHNAHCLRPMHSR